MVFIKFIFIIPIFLKIVPLDGFLFARKMIEKVKLIGIGAVSGICLSYSLYYYIQHYCTKNKKREASKYLGLSSLYNNSPLIRLDSLSKGTKH